MQAHDALHKGDTDEAHEQLHAAMGAGERDLSVEPLRDGLGFDKAFRRLCVQHGVVAMYVRSGEPDEDGLASLGSGGDGQLCTYVDAAIRARLAVET